MTHIYGLWYHVEMPDDSDDDDVNSVIGYFSTEEKAKQAIAVVKDRPAFRHPAGEFVVLKEPLDKVQAWAEGFVTFQEAWDALDEDAAEAKGKR